MADDKARNSLMTQGFTKVRFEIGGTVEGVRNIGKLTDLYESDLQTTPAFTKERFREKFLTQYVTKPNFTLVLLWVGEELIGFACGNTLTRDTRWWHNVKEDLSEGLTEENGARTVAVKDIVVKASHRGKGLGRELHERFLNGRAEERVTLLSSINDQPAHSIWQNWGYRKVGTVEPEGTNETLDVFIRSLT